MVFFVDFGVLLALRNWERGDFYVPWGNKTFTIGDSVLLPAYAAFATVAVRQPVSRSTARWWNPASLVGGLGLAAFLDAVAIAQGHSSVLSDPAPSKLYHALIAPFIFWLLVRLLPTVWAARGSRPALLALLALGGYLAICGVELHHSAGPTLGVAASGVESAATAWTA